MIDNKDKITVEEEDEDFKIPTEVKRVILKIMNDSPTLVMVGEKQYMIKNLRTYSLNRILELGFDLCKTDESIDSDKKMLFSLCTDINKGCEIVAILLCNHLFTPDNVDFSNPFATITYNEKLINYMKVKILNSTFDTNQWAAIILSALKSIDLSQLFTMLTLVKQFTDSLTSVRTKAEEQLQYWQEAKSAI